VIISHEYDPRTEEIARALAKADGYPLAPEAYGPAVMPSGQAAAYWCRAVAAIIQIHHPKSSHV
jgi:hypothetical protein